MRRGLALWELGGLDHYLFVTVSTTILLLTSTMLLVYASSIVSTVVDCEALTRPANGQVDTSSGTTYNQVATYNCDTGYSLVGSSTRACQASGMWSSTEPVCIGEYIYLQAS